MLTFEPSLRILVAPISHIKMSFLIGLHYSDQYVHYTHTERQSTDPLIQAKYLPSQLVSTLESLDYIIVKPPTPSRGVLDILVFIVLGM